MSFRLCMGGGDTLNLGAVGSPVWEVIRDHHDIPGTITRVSPWGQQGAPGSWWGSPSRTIVGVACPNKCMMTPSWTSTPLPPPLSQLTRPLSTISLWRSLEARTRTWMACMRPVQEPRIL